MQAVTLSPTTSDTQSWDVAIKRHESECNVVYFIPGPRTLGKIKTVDPYTRAKLRRKFYRARRLVRASTLPLSHHLPARPPARQPKLARLI